MASNLFIIVGTHHIDGSDVFYTVDNGALKALRYLPYRNAAKEHGNKPARFSMDEATRFSEDEANEYLAAEAKIREGRNDNEFWVHDLRAVPLD